MTTSPGYQSEEWTPLDQSGRTWETNLSSSKPRTTTTRPVQDRPRPGSRGANGAHDDLAIEAGYSRPGRLTSPASLTSDTEERMIDHPTQGASRYKPPIIKEQHVWGVTDEWGKKAGKWGEGAKAFNHQSGSGPAKREPGDDDGGRGKS